MTDTTLQAQIDAQLLEQGVFAPLDLLIDSGRLIPSDYEGWRRQDFACLDDVLMGSKDKIRAQLEAAADYARRIGLVQELQIFHAWNSAAVDGSPPLRISVDPHLHALIASRYVPAQKAPQLDLFFDNPVVALTNGVVCALSARNRAEAQRQLDRLYVQAPNHADLGAFDRLLAALAHWEEPSADSRRELEYLLEIAPTAKRLLGFQARDLLAPAWRRLADALSASAFSADEPALHRSFALSQAQDWPGVAASVRGERGWWLHAPLCLRLAQSSFYQQRRSEALEAWCHLCWRFPAQAMEVLDNRRQPDTGMTALWLLFVDTQEACCRDVAAQPAMTVADFPAWLLLHEPGLTSQLPAALALGSTPAEASYRCVHDWIQARRMRRDGEEMALRKVLQATSPALFHYLKQGL